MGVILSAEDSLCSEFWGLLRRYINPRGLREVGPAAPPDAALLAAVAGLLVVNSLTVKIGLVLKELDTLTSRKYSNENNTFFLF